MWCGIYVYPFYKIKWVQILYNIRVFLDIVWEIPCGTFVPIFEMKWVQRNSGLYKRNKSIHQKTSSIVQNATPGRKRTSRKVRKSMTSKAIGLASMGRYPHPLDVWKNNGKILTVQTEIQGTIPSRPLESILRGLGGALRPLKHLPSIISPLTCRTP